MHAKKIIDISLQLYVLHKKYNVKKKIEVLMPI